VFIGEAKRTTFFSPHSKVQGGIFASQKARFCLEPRGRGEARACARRTPWLQCLSESYKHFLLPSSFQMKKTSFSSLLASAPTGALLWLCLLTLDNRERAARGLSCSQHQRPCSGLTSQGQRCSGQIPGALLVSHDHSPQPSGDGFPGDNTFS
jgi:hypothetical protein